MPSAYDRDRHRPLEIRVIDHRDGGGVSENDAASNNGITADAMLLMRVLVEEGSIAMSFSAIEGWTAQEMSYDALFNLWIGLTSELARYKTRSPDQEKLRVFVERVLNLMRLNTSLETLEADRAAQAD